jgi:hypothetical protein
LRYCTYTSSNVCIHQELGEATWFEQPCWRERRPFSDIQQLFINVDDYFVFAGEASFSDAMSTGLALENTMELS